ncbi:MAG: hypothetical protein ND807_04105 [Vicinamibacterales bacterium]|nr:hypothetical protein [Vicinamibacterales bacterium]
MSQQHEFTTWVMRIQAEYRDMPGLHLTEPQIQRLWGLDETTCAAILEALVTRRILVKTHHNAYVRL